MSRRCDISGVGVQVGNNVSHSKRKTRRRFLPNLQQVSLLSDSLRINYKLKIAAKTLRSVENNGGLDSYLLSTADKNLTAEALKIKKTIKSAVSRAEAKE
jgi:large subunit ribosomal protein L28